MRRTLLVAALAGAAVIPACRVERAPAGRPGGYPPEPDSVAAAEVYAALRSYYAAFTARDWPLVASHFWPGATVTTIWSPPGDTSEDVHSQAIGEFVRRAAEGSGRLAVFEQRMVRASVVAYGPLADAWVTYRARFGATADSVEARHGIDAFHLLKHGGHWRIAGLTFQNEIAGRPIQPPPADRRD